MSTTVTYKGQTLTTVENQTKTLQTAGTWVEGDFTLTDVTQGGGGLEYVSGTATITQNTNVITHNANYNYYLWHAWIDDYSTITEDTNAAVEYWGFYNADYDTRRMPMNIASLSNAATLTVRWKPSTGNFAYSAGVTNNLTKTPTQCVISGGSGYGAHTEHMWHWECINLEGLVR